MVICDAYTGTHNGVMVVDGSLFAKTTVTFGQRKKGTLPKRRTKKKNSTLKSYGDNCHRCIITGI